MICSNHLARKRLKRLAEVFAGLSELDSQSAPYSLNEYLRDAEQYLIYLGWDPKGALFPHTLQAWRDHMQDHSRVSPNTINRRVFSVKFLVKLCAEMGTIPRELALAVAKVERIPVATLKHRLNHNSRVTYSPAQIRRLCQAPDHSTLLGLRDRALLLTLASSGIKSRELITLQQGDILPWGKGFCLRVRVKGPEEYRLAPFSREAHKWVQRWLGARPVTSEIIFTTPCGKAMSWIAVWRTVKLYAHQTSLAEITPHSLRLFVAREIRKKHGPRLARKVLGNERARDRKQHYLLDDLPERLTDRLF